MKPSVAGVALLGLACFIGRHNDIVRPSGTTIQVHVTNHHSSAVEVYAVASGTSYQMGTVLPGLEGFFTLRQAMVDAGPVEFVAQPYGGTAARSGRLLLVPGDIVDFEVAEHLLNSSATVRPWQLAQ